MSAALFEIGRQALDEATEGAPPRSPKINQLFASAAREAKARANPGLEDLGAFAFDQDFLPPSLRLGNTRAALFSGIQSIGELLRNPGGLNPNIADAIRPRVAAESERVARNFQGIRQQQRGAAARSNLPVSIRNALDAALDVSQERAQRGVRREALSESEDIRRRDLENTFRILDAILQFQSSGRGQAIQGLAVRSGIESQDKATQLALLSSLLQSGALSGNKTERETV